MNKHTNEFLRDVFIAGVIVLLFVLLVSFGCSTTTPSNYLEGVRIEAARRMRVPVTQREEKWFLAQRRSILAEEIRIELRESRMRLNSTYLQALGVSEAEADFQARLVDSMLGQY